MSVVSTALFLLSALLPPNDRDAENPPAPRSSSGASGSQRANTGLVKMIFSRCFSSVVPPACFRPALAGAGTSSFKSPRLRRVTPLVSEWRSRAKRMASTRATRNDRPPDRIAHRNRAISSRSATAGLRRCGRTSASASNTASETAVSASRAADLSASRQLSRRRKLFELSLLKVDDVARS